VNMKLSVNFLKRQHRLTLCKRGSELTLCPSRMPLQGSFFQPVQHCPTQGSPDGYSRGARKRKG
jgi:hypothetical protein